MHIWVESGTLLKYPMPFLILFPLTSSLLWATDICAWVYVHLMFDLLFCYYNDEMEVRRDRYMYIYVDIEKRRETVRGRARYREKQWQLRVQRYLVPDCDFENVSSSITQSFYWIVLKPLLHLSDKFHFTFSNLWSNNCYLQFYKSYHAHAIILNGSRRCDLDSDIIWRISSNKWIRMRTERSASRSSSTSFCCSSRIDRWYSACYKTNTAIQSFQVCPCLGLPHKTYLSISNYYC